MLHTADKTDFTMAGRYVVMGSKNCQHVILYTYGLAGRHGLHDLQAHPAAHPIQNVVQLWSLSGKRHSARRVRLNFIQVVQPTKPISLWVLTTNTNQWKLTSHLSWHGEGYFFRDCRWGVGRLTTGFQEYFEARVGWTLGWMWCTRGKGCGGIHAWSSSSHSVRLYHY